jgi:nicotinic acid mononucleotide adenylyltransferase
MKLNLKECRFDTTVEIQAKLQRVLDTLTGKDFQEVFQKWRRLWDQCLNASRVMVANRPYGEFYDFYSVSPEYFGYHLVYLSKLTFNSNSTNK